MPTEVPGSECDSVFGVNREHDFVSGRCLRCHAVDLAPLIDRLWAANCPTAANRLRNGWTVDKVLAAAKRHQYIRHAPDPIPPMPCPWCVRAVKIIEAWKGDNDA